MKQDHRQLVAHFVEMINQRDAGSIDLHTAVDHIDHNPVVGDGREANKAFWQEVFTAFPDITAVLHDIVVDGDRVAGRFEYVGTHLGPFLGIPATGLPVRIDSIDIWRVENGLLAEHWDQLNMGDIFRQIGATPPSAPVTADQS